VLLAGFLCDKIAAPRSLATRRDVATHDLEDGVQRLVSCRHQVMPNAYHDA
jgi:hypothetical protein